MITASRDTADEGRDSYALFLLESSGYVDTWKQDIEQRILNGTPDEIELIIEDLLLNQVDNWNNYRLKDINRRLNKHECH